MGLLSRSFSSHLRMTTPLARSERPWVTEVVVKVSTISWPLSGWKWRNRRYLGLEVGNLPAYHLIPQPKNRTRLLLGVPRKVSITKFWESNVWVFQECGLYAEFSPRSFLKKMAAYKSADLEGHNPKTDSDELFWGGAVDVQELGKTQQWWTPNHHV